MSVAKPWSVESPIPLTSHVLWGVPGSRFSVAIGLAASICRDSMCSITGRVAARCMAHKSAAAVRYDERCLRLISSLQIGIRRWMPTRGRTILVRSGRERRSQESRPLGSIQNAQTNSHERGKLRQQNKLLNANARAFIGGDARVD